MSQNDSHTFLHRHGTALTLTLIVLLGAWMRLIGLTVQSYWYDELLSAFFSNPRHSFGEALEWVRNENDRRVVQAMLDLDPERVTTEALKHQNACCPGAAAGAVTAVRRLGATKAETLAYATSYDKSPGDSFVGYVGILFE